MKPIYYRDDFKLTVEFTCDGKPVRMPSIDFTGALYTEGTFNSGVVRFGRHNGVDTGFRLTDDGALQLSVDNRGFALGRLILEIAWLLPNETYADGHQRIERRYHLDIEIVNTRADDSCGCTSPCPSESCSCIPPSATATVEIPWQYIHDTDVYAEILRKVNAALDDILGEGGGTAAPSRKAAPSSRAVRVQRGMMRTTAEPGVVYDCYKRPCQCAQTIKDGFVLSPWVESGAWWDYSRAFPDGKFYDAPIRFLDKDDIEHDIENHRVRNVVHNNAGGGKFVVIIKLPYWEDGRYQHYLTTDTDGRVVCAAITGAVERPMLPDDFEIDKLCDREELYKWAYATATDGSKLELQWYIGRGCSGETRQSFDFFNKRRFRRVKNVTNRGIGVFRVRRHTNRGYRSAWVYYTMLIREYGRRSLIRIQK